MYLLYLDESGNSSLSATKYPASDFFVLGGVIVKESEYFNTISKFNDFKEEFFHKKCELKR